MKDLILALFLVFSFDLAANEILRINIDAGIGPATSAYIESSIEEAADDNYEALVIELNTPGGLLESTRDIVENIMESEVPVVVYVSPSGARAGSAGVFITQSAHIAAMAPGTNMGSASPVGIGGESDTTTMYKKVTNDAAAFIRSIVEERGRNANWAERTVIDAISSTAKEALDSGAIDYIATDLDSLLVMMNGDTVKTKYKELILKTENAKVVTREMNWREELLSFLSDPNIAYIFILVGFYGILFELYNPGAIFPGVLGGISVLLAAYSLQMLPVNYAGLGLMVLAIILFIVEVFVSSYGLLTIGGIVSFALGSIMLIDSPFEFMEISMTLIITATVLTALFFIVLIGFGVKAQFRKKNVGGDTISGSEGRVTKEISPSKAGEVYVHGERWSAISDEELEKDSEIIVESISGMKLKVKRK